MGACIKEGTSCIRQIESKSSEMTSWFRGGLDAIEQGWTIDTPPAGTGALAFQVRFEGAKDLKVDIESLKRDLDNMNTINGRIDTAIDKLTDVSSSIKSMLAVHEEKIQRQEKIDEVIFDKLKDRASEISDVYRELKKDVELSEKRLLIEIKSLKNDIGARVGVLEKYRWIIIGGAIVIGWILSKNFMPIMHMMASN